MNICVIGTGYAGLVSGACLSEVGHHVTCVDIDEKKIDALRQGEVPIYEPGLEEIVKKNSEEGNLVFTTQLKEGLGEAKVILNAVGTPPDHHRKVDLRYVRQAAEEVGELLDHYVVFVNKSTVPVGTADEVGRIIEDNLSEDVEFDVASNPEFLREGNAVKDFMEPDRIVVGVSSDRSKQVLTEMYQPLVESGAELLITDTKSAELTKYASNAFLATKITFINELANLSEEVGADVLEVARGMGLDTRIGPKFLQPGPGFGGSCFPKDVDALIHTAIENGVDLRILESVIGSNRKQQLIAVYKLRKYFDTFVGKTFAVWGLSFKPNTDDIRESSAIKTIQTLLQLGANIQCYDPEAMENAKETLGNSAVHYAEDEYEALEGADALLLMTEWEEFEEVDAVQMEEALEGTVVIDARNIWDRSFFDSTGLVWEGVGR